MGGAGRGKGRGRALTGDLARSLDPLPWRGGHGMNRIRKKLQIQGCEAGLGVVPWETREPGLSGAYLRVLPP